MIRRHFVGELRDQFRREAQWGSASLWPGSLRCRFETRWVGDRRSERGVHGHEQSETANYFCFHADPEFLPAPNDQR
jgi:hypothetical protein